MGLIRKFQNKFQAAFDDELSESSYAYDDYSADYDDELIEADLNDELDFDTVDEFGASEDDFSIPVRSTSQDDGLDGLSEKRFANLRSLLEKPRDEKKVSVPGYATMDEFEIEPPAAKVSTAEERSYPLVNERPALKLKLNVEKKHENKKLERSVEGSSTLRENLKMGYEAMVDVSINEIVVSNKADLDHACKVVKNGNAALCFLEGQNEMVLNQFACYMAGFADALDGKFERISDSIYLMTPARVDYVRNYERLQNYSQTRYANELG
ncbi:MAG: cell division protein SepF [Eubacteriales bacterium]|nr:cell division protein SepF [Eubacteriales bacterium]